jgi:hypothetical protein
MTPITLPRATVEQALEALEWSWGGEPMGTLERDAITALRAALSQQAEPVEPVAWMYTGIKQDGTEHGPHLVWKPEYMDAMSASKGAKATPLYTALSQQAEPVAWVRLEAWKSGQSWPDDCFTALPAEGLTPLHTAPPQRKPLTEEDIDCLWHDSGAGIELSRFSSIARAVERKVRGEEK